MRVLPLDAQVQEVPEVEPSFKENSNDQSCVDVKPIFMIAYQFYQITGTRPVFGHVKYFKKLLLRHCGILEKFLIANNIELVVTTELDPGVEYSYEECREIYAKLALLSGSAARVKAYPPISVCTSMMDKALRDARFPPEDRLPTALFALEKEKVPLVLEQWLKVDKNTTLFNAISQLREKISKFAKVWHFQISTEK